MKRLLLLIIGAFMALPVFAQNDEPTANWPYIYPDFMEGELEVVRKKPFKGVFNIHLSRYNQRVQHHGRDKAYHR